MRCLSCLLFAACAPVASEAPLPPPPPPERAAVIDGGSSCFGAGLAAAGDVDGDGYDDLLVGATVRDACASGIQLLPGGPDGPQIDQAVALLHAAGFGNGFGIDLHAAGDGDGDGYDDVAVASRDGVCWYRGGPAGLALEAAATRAQTGDPDDGADVAGSGDMNGDGFDDLAACMDGAAVLFPGGPSGPSEAWAVTVAGQCQGDLRGVGDIDSDGFDDLLTASDGDDFLVHGAADLGGEVERLDPEVEPHSSKKPAFAAAGDLTGDGRVELASGRAWSGVSLFCGTAEGYAPEPCAVLQEPLLSDGYGAALDLGGDLDGDGLSELIVGAGRELGKTGGAVLYTGHADGPGAGSVLRFDDQGLNALGMSVVFPGDLDGDGLDDLAIGSPGERRVYLFYGGGRRGRRRLGLAARLRGRRTGREPRGRRDLQRPGRRLRRRGRGGRRRGRDRLVRGRRRRRLRGAGSGGLGLRGPRGLPGGWPALGLRRPRRRHPPRSRRDPG